MERPRLARAILGIALGVDVTPFYKSMAVLSELEDSAVVLDAPCGGGIALRAVRPKQSVRYLGVDISEQMLRRFRCRAMELSIDAKAIKADLRNLPLSNGSADLCLSYNGLHMLPDPRQGLAEIVRCLRPGGRLVGATLIAEGTRRQSLQLELAARRGASGRAPSRDDLAHWLDAEGIKNVSVSPGPGLSVFCGRKGQARV